MLVLSRFVGQSIIIGDNIKIKIFKNIFGQIHISIEAPRDIVVHREEVYNE